MNTLTLSDSIKDYYRLLMASKTEKNASCAVGFFN